MVCKRYEIEGFRFGIRTTSRAFSEWIDHVLAAYRSPDRPDDDDREATYSIVIEDSADPAQLGKRFHILYLGGWDIVRTLDLRFMAEMVYRDLESILYPIRRDAVFLEVGVVDMAGALAIVPSYLVPALNRAKRRGARRGVTAPGGVYAQLELGSGRVVPPTPMLDVPDDAVASIDRFMDVPARTEHQPFTESRPLDLVFERVYAEDQRLWMPTRADILQGLTTRARNLRVLGGVAVETLAEAVRHAQVYRGWYGSTNEMLDMFAELGTAAGHAT